MAADGKRKSIWDCALAASLLLMEPAEAVHAKGLELSSYVFAKPSILAGE
jgi:hypothetical protein